MVGQVNHSIFSESEEEFIHSLYKNNLLKKEDVKKLKVIVDSGKTELSSFQLILNLGMLSELDMLNHVSKVNHLRILSSKQYPKKIFSKDSFNIQFLREHNFIVISETDEIIEICINDPYKKGLNEAISFALGERFLKIRFGYKKDIIECLDRLLKDDEGKELVDKFDSLDEVLLEKDIQQLKELASEAPVIKMVNSIIQTGIQNNSSDIHIEPQESYIKIRNRMDGVLIDIEKIPMNYSPAIVSRIKILSSLDIAQRRVPQDGRFDLSIDGQDIDVRASIVPTIHGESIVLRLLYKKSISFDFESLGYSPKNKQKIYEMLSKPHGLIMVTGPTGSGKSTTLYAMLQQINSSEKKIVSVEDPVEYKIDGVNQIQVHPDIGMSFASALKAIVRHDPEIIMVGEMRDFETAEIAVRASMTGHLILTTLHTNSAVSSIARLVDLGVEKSIFLSSLIGVVAQRLIRRLCDHCKTPIYVDALEVDKESLNVRLNEELPFTCYEAKGCEHCHETGYKGRISISEVMLINEAFRSEALLENADVNALAKKYGMNSMTIDGFDKIKNGDTSIEELFRVVLE